MANYDCEIKILERDNKMLEEIANGNPELSEKLISYSIRHAINSATSTYIWMISELNRERELLGHLWPSSSRCLFNRVVISQRIMGTDTFPIQLGTVPQFKFSIKLIMFCIIYLSFPLLQLLA